MQQPTGLYHTYKIKCIKNNNYLSLTILGDNPLEKLPLPKIPPGDNPPLRLEVLTLTDPQRGVLTLTDLRSGELSENWN